MKKIISALMLSLTLFVPFIAEASFDKDLYYGLRDDSQVKELQEFLTDQELYSGPITGNFYSLTLRSVKNFQAKEGIAPAAGYFGPITRIRANEILGLQIEDSNKQSLGETGQTPAPPSPAADSATLLQNQILLLQQQIALLLQQIQQAKQNQTAESVAATPAVPATPAQPAKPAEEPAVPATPASPAVPTPQTSVPATTTPTPAPTPEPASSTTSYVFTQITANDKTRGKSSINSSGEIVWEEIINGNWQIMSNTRGQITSGAKTHESPSINDGGEIVWNEKKGDYVQVFSNIRGQVTNGDTHHMEPSINDLGEIIWHQNDQVFSNIKGQITSGVNGKIAPSINSQGEIVWQEKINGNWQIISNTRGQITSGDYWHWRPDINDNGEIVWHEWPNGLSKAAQIVSNIHGTITSGEKNHYNPSINDNGIIVFDEEYENGKYHLIEADPATTPTPACGNNIIEEGEACDTSDILVGKWVYHCNSDCTVRWCSIGQVRTCPASVCSGGSQGCTSEGKWEDCACPTSTP